ncbi:MAG: 16S rRNA (adenine(1518)-N(6)/adenine(1519)-N(6))-dimethyltransferase RsmA [Gammaproteobacteria bacterium]|nr:16S rRNA (adenine(1518)-N(6)/adenine(1519)-N(6))-dimethyltransferase RsmA [Gammaproteobacteria bacterium]
MSDAELSRLVAKKRFGQHFLHEAGVVRRIVAAVAPRPGDNLIEIGPGPGALTPALLEAAGALRAIEIDRDVIPHLRAACGDRPGLEIVQADVLTVDFRRLADRGPLRLVGNLPYNISSPLLFHVLEAADCVRDMHFMLQKEVVDRICAAPDTEDYGRLTVAIAARAEAVPLFNVAPGAFQPPPRVDSAVVRLIPRPPPFPVRDLATFDRVVKQAFSQRRKTLRNTLRGLLDADAIQAAGIDPGTRAEQLAPEQFARLAGRLAVFSNP